MAKVVKLQPPGILLVPRLELAGISDGEVMLDMMHGGLPDLPHPSSSSRSPSAVLRDLLKTGAWPLLSSLGVSAFPRDEMVALGTAASPWN